MALQIEPISAGNVLPGSLAAVRVRAGDYG